jgi:hypothetical protein
LTLAFDFLDHGIPVVICKPREGWTWGSKRSDLIPPARWSVISAAEARTELTRPGAFRPGIDALAMVGGHGVDAVDVDPKAGGSVANLPGFRHYGVHITPSGGEHYLVPSTGMAKISPLTTSAGHVGDYIGGTAEGASRALLYLPGSARPKYPGKTYRIQRRVDLDLLLDEEPDDELIAALEGAGGRRTGNPGRPAATLTAVDAFLVEHDRRLEPECTFGRKIVREELAKADGTVPGHPTAGRHGWCQRTLIRLVELIRSGCANTADLRTVAAKLDEIKPEGDDFTAMVAWALANADGDVPCSVHRPSSGELEMRTAVRDILGKAAGSADSAVSATTPSDAFAEPPIELTPATCPSPFPVNALPGWAADMVDAVAIATQTDAGMAGTVVLGALAAAAGGHVRVAVRAGWIEPVNLFTATAAEPGSRKSQEIGKVGEFTGRGLLARVLYSLPPSLVGRRQVGAAEVPPSAAETYGRILRQLAKALHGWQEPQTLILSPEAAALHLEAERQLEPRLGPGGDLRPVVEWASKLMGAIARLAGLLHIAEHGAELAALRPIGADTMSAALSLGAYFTAHARVAFDLMGADPAVARGQDVLDHVHGRQLAEVSVRDLFTALSRSRFPKTEDVMSALEVLVAHGWAARQPEPAASGPGRRPSPRFRFRPR